jgi:glycosyltransferase involved in cell wall biosynthesis
MKIGIDARLWNETGVGRYIRNLVSELLVIDRTNDYILFVRRHDAESIKKQVLGIKKVKIVIADIRWHTLDEQLKLPQILNKENLDLVHFPYFSVPVRYNRPFVMTIHDLIINHFPTGKASKLPLYLYKLKRMGYNYIVRKALERAQKIIVPLNAVRDDLIDTLGVDNAKIAVTYEGFDDKLRKSGSQAIDNTRYFLYVGNAYPHKNLDRLIKAFAIFRKEQDEDTQLLLVGKSDYFYKKLEEKIIKENYSNITIRNNVSDKELGDLYYNAIVLVSPSLMEGFGLPVLEAMSSECLVMASDIPSFREVCHDSAIFFDPYSVEDMTNKMEHVIKLDSKSRDQYINNGFERSKEFSWEKMAKETLKIYENSTSASSV